MTVYEPPSVPVFNAGYGPQATDFNTWWMQTAGFLSTRVVLRVAQETAATSLPDSGAATLIHYDTVLEDPYDGWDGSTYLWTPPAGYSGFYQATLTIRTDGVANLVALRPVLAGTFSYTLACVQGQSNAGAGVCATFTTYLVGGQDTIGGACELLNSGAAVNTDITAGQNSTLELVWISQS
jgi:hypothetical protein